MHARAEGVLEYTYLLFVPSQKPFDLFDPERKTRLKLYVRRVFITDEGTELLPSYLRFLRGIVDSEDLPLNISREMLQSNPMVARIRQQLTRRVLGELGKKASEAPEEYAKFWDNFGAVLKEGLYEDREQRDTLLGLARFRSTTRDGLVSLDDYVAAMRPGQEAIYTITGDNLDLLREEPAARRLPRPRRRGAVADRPDRRVLDHRRSAPTRKSRSNRRRAAAPTSPRSRRPRTRRTRPTSRSRRPSSPA